MKEVRRGDGGNVLWTFEEFEGGGCEGRLYSRIGGRWQPPLPPDVAPPIGTGEPSRSIARSSGHVLEAVEIRTRSTEPETFCVDLSLEAKRDILEEVSFVRRSFGGEPREACGYLFAAQRPRGWWNHLSIGLATRAGDSRHGLTSVQFGAEPLDVRRSFPPELAHMEPCGDFHSHPIPGSTIPSDADARAWAGQMDRAGLERWVGLLISPSEGNGWLAPVISPWSVRRDGDHPVCEPAVLAW
jgi:hypothetical protein